MRDIVLYGASGGADEVEFIIQRINEQTSPFLTRDGHTRYAPNRKWNIVGRIITNLNEEEKDKVIGDESWLDNHSDIDIAICIAHPQIRYRLSAHLKEKYPKLNFPILIDPDVIIDYRDTYIGEGSIINAGTKISRDFHMGDFSWVSFNCTLGHNSKMGIGSVIFPGCTIAGHVYLLDRVLLGAGTNVIPCTIGNDVVIGAGSVVIRDIPNNSTAVGSPAKVIKHVQR